MTHLRGQIDDYRCSEHCSFVLDVIETRTNSHKDGLINSIRLESSTFGLPEATYWYGGYGQNGSMIGITFYVHHPGKGHICTSYGYS
jgi:hypothetical protein